MTRIRAEVLEQIHEREGTPLRSFAVARMAAVERLGHLVRPLYNFFARWQPSAALLKRILRFAAERQIPTLSRHTLRQLLRRDGFATAFSAASPLPAAPPLLTASVASVASPVAPASPSAHESGDFVREEPLSAPSAHESADFVREKSLSASSAHESADFVREAGLGGRRVYLFADEFTNYQEAELGLTFARLLRRLGYDVVVPKHVESGRAAISKGCLKLARRFAVRNVRLLADLVTADAPLVGIEPSCILSFRDEYPDLVPPEMRQTARDLAANCLLFDEFIMREVAAGRISSEVFRDDPVEVWLHGHCHQKAFVGIDKTTAALRLLPCATVHVIPSSCCGMAGSFGYEKEHYHRSLEIGEMVLFPAVRRALGPSSDRLALAPASAPSGRHAPAAGSTPTVVIAPGTSCRQQILDGTGAHAVHPVELLYNWLR